MKRNRKYIYIFILLGSALVFILLVRGTEAAYSYNSYGRRDPFVPLVGVVRGGTAGGALSIFSIDDAVLQGIVTNLDGSLSAIINGEIMKEGQMLGRLKVESVGNNVVKIKINEENFEIKLYEE
ncbi:MAG: hypothetical protein HQ594_00360 [Candidatus Omnitrophica bacterium]|nr:hypothetical protein [Candidatus Omnitrophota bacterium]